MALPKETPFKLVVAFSSRALFDLSESHQVFVTQGVQAYRDYQIAHENDILEPGVAFPLAKKLLALNERLGTRGRVEIVLLSRNSSDTGLRILMSAEHHGLAISRAVFSGGESCYRYISGFHANLFLSAEADDVELALRAGHAAATVLPGKQHSNDSTSEQVRIAFDGDAVIFNDDAEKLFQKEGIDAFNNSEIAFARTPLPDGPFKGFLQAIYQLQNLFPDSEHQPVRTALVTARGMPAHERVIRTLRGWGIRIDESLFLGGLPKSEFLRAFNADIFFDDRTSHCEAANELVTTGHVPYGVVNNS